ncbi:MAG: hypothetical protein AAB214_20965, partial [Fibrobacterota bacterium]
MFGALDTSLWDGAALGTVLFAAVALLRKVASKIHLRRRRAPAIAAVLIVAALAAGARADEPKAK